MLTFKPEEWKGTEEDAIASFKAEVGVLRPGDRLIRNDAGEFMVVVSSLASCHIDQFEVVKVYG